MEYTDNIEFTSSSISIKLDDCGGRNKERRFSLTYKSIYMGGCWHDVILEHRPEYKCFADIHLSNEMGQPMHATANGSYWVKEKNWENVQSSLRLTHEELNALENDPSAIHSDYLACWLEDKGIVKRWAAEAGYAKAYLQALIDNQGKESALSFPWREANYTWYKLDEIREKIAAGYYDPEKEMERQKAEKEKAKLAKIADLKKQAEKKIANINLKLNFDLFFLENEINNDNVIYYDHSNELNFNWHANEYSTYCKKWSEEEIVDFIKQYGQLDLFKGVNFTNNKKTISIE